MDQSTINLIAFASCLLGLGVGWWMLRWARRERTALASEQPALLKRKLGLWGRRANALVLMAGAIFILYLSAMALVSLFTRH